ncbi:hypothetical protein STEG23_027411, partial [Scotinomys teguina]
MNCKYLHFCMNPNTVLQVILNSKALFIVLKFEKGDMYCHLSFVIKIVGSSGSTPKYLLSFLYNEHIFSSFGYKIFKCQETCSKSLPEMRNLMQAHHGP